VPRRLNGWQRLWVVVSLLYLLVIMTLARPTADTVFPQQEWLLEMPAESVALIRAVTEGGRIIWENPSSIPPPPDYSGPRSFQPVVVQPSRVVLMFDAWVPKESASAVASEYAAILEAATRKQRFSFIGRAFLAWS